MSNEQSAVIDLSGNPRFPHGNRGAREMLVEAGLLQEPADGELWSDPLPAGVPLSVEETAFLIRATRHVRGRALNLSRTTRGARLLWRESPWAIPPLADFRRRNLATPSVES